MTFYSVSYEQWQQLQETTIVYSMTAELVNIHFNLTWLVVGIRSFIAEGFNPSSVQMLVCNVVLCIHKNVWYTRPGALILHLGRGHGQDVGAGLAGRPENVPGHWKRKQTWCQWFSLFIQLFNCVIVVFLCPQQTKWSREIPECLSLSNRQKYLLVENFSVKPPMLCESRLSPRMAHTVPLTVFPKQSIITPTS